MALRARELGDTKSTETFVGSDQLTIVLITLSDAMGSGDDSTMVATPAQIVVAEPLLHSWQSCVHHCPGQDLPRTGQIRSMVGFGVVRLNALVEPVLGSGVFPVLGDVDWSSV